MKTFLKKHTELKKLQGLYLCFLKENEDPLPIESYLKLANEIARLDHQIKHIAEKSLTDLQKPIHEWELQATSQF